jgi:CheY-like chemotaxis protein
LESPRLVDVGAQERLILAVDDGATVRELVERHLQRSGFAVVTAGGGQEGLRLRSKQCCARENQENQIRPAWTPA